MLRQNKSIIATLIIFVAALILGAYTLRSSGADITPPSQPEYDANYDPDGTGSRPEDTPDTPPRQPLTIAGPIDCRCDIASSTPIRPLAPLRQPHDPVQIESLHIGQEFTMLLEQDGSLWGWGGNHRGMLGGGDMLEVTPLKILDSVVAVTPGGGSAIRADGSLWAWGIARMDESPFVAQGSPVPPRHVLDDVAAFYSSTRGDFAIRTDGSLWAWPNNQRAQFSWPGRYVPYENADPVYVLDCVVDFSLSHISAFARQCNGILWCVFFDTPSPVMFEVASFYPNTGVNAWLNQTLVVQSDNSLWAVDSNIRTTHPSRQRPPRHLLDDVSAVYRTDDNAFILQTCGRLWAMGNNEMGCLGDGTTTFRFDPVLIMDNVAYVSVQNRWERHANIAIQADGSLWAWGTRDRFDGRSQYPVHIMDDVMSAYVGWTGNFTIGPGGSLWSWGDGPPAHMMDGVTQVYTAGDIVMALDDDGSLWIWEPNRINPFYGAFADETDERWREPRRVLDAVTTMYNGPNRIYIMQADGGVWVYGATPDGLLRYWDGMMRLRGPVNISYAFSYAPGVVGVPPWLGDPPDVPFTPAVNRGPPHMALTWHRFYVDAEYRLWTWDYYRLNPLDNSLSYIYAPEVVMEQVTYVNTTSNGVKHALQKNGDLWHWPWDPEGGNEPVLIMGRVAAFFDFWGTSFAVREDGSLWGWGNAWSGLLPGVSHLEYHTDPVQIMESVAALHLDSNAAFAHRHDGTLWSWGQNRMGFLGDNRDTSFLAEGVPPGFVTNEVQAAAMLPVPVMSDVAIFRLQGHSAFAVQTDGSLWAWGDNRAGQLGDGTRQTRRYPVFIMDGVVDIHTTDNSTFAIRADGTVWAWGWNSQGQLGDGTAVSRLTPTRIIGNVRDMHLVPGASFAILENDSLWAWGGRFGYAPMLIMNAAASIYTRSNDPFSHFVIGTNGRLWVLDYGHAQPQLVMEDVAEVFSVLGEVFAVRGNGELWTWGRLRNMEFVGRDDAVKIDFNG